jgi:hypothetical protein
MLAKPSALCAALALTMSSLPMVARAAGGDDSTVELVAVQAEDGSLASSDGPTVYIELAKPDPDRGAVKLARYRSTTATAAPNAVVVTTLYDELCTEPCGAAVDVSERPLFFFVRDGQPISYAFRLNQFEGPVTLKVRPVKKGLLMAGATLAVFIIGIPMWIAAVSKVWAAPGEPGSATAFKKLKKAKT